MKAKHIISAVLIVVLPFVLIFCFGSLSDYLHKMASQTFMFRYSILNMLVTAIPLVAYIFWLSFIMRTKNRKVRILLICCSFATDAFLIILFSAPWIMPVLHNVNFLLTTSLTWALANLFAGVYMLIKSKKYEEN